MCRNGAGDDRLDKFDLEARWCYNLPMHNWDYPKQKNIKKDDKWFLERALTYGPGGEKIDKDALKRHFKDLRIPEHTRAFFELLLWNKPF